MTGTVLQWEPELVFLGPPDPEIGVLKQFCKAYEPDPLDTTVYVTRHYGPKPSDESWGEHHNTPLSVGIQGAAGNFGPWVPGAEYAADTTTVVDGVLLQATEDHEAHLTDFFADMAAGLWVPLSDHGRPETGTIYTNSFQTLPTGVDQPTARTLYVQSTGSGLFNEVATMHTIAATAGKKYYLEARRGIRGTRGWRPGPERLWISGALNADAVNTDLTVDGGLTRAAVGSTKAILRTGFWVIHIPDQTMNFNALSSISRGGLGDYAEGLTYWTGVVPPVDASLVQPIAMKGPWIAGRVAS